MRFVPFICVFWAGVWCRMTVLHWYWFWLHHGFGQYSIWIRRCCCSCIEASVLPITTVNDDEGGVAHFGLHANRRNQKWRNTLFQCSCSREFIANQPTKRATFDSSSSSSNQFSSTSAAIIIDTIVNCRKKDVVVVWFNAENNISSLDSQSISILRKHIVKAENVYRWVEAYM